MSLPLPYENINFTNTVDLTDNLATGDYAETGYFAEVDMYYPDGIEESTK